MIPTSASAGGQNGKDSLGSGSLSEFAKRALTEICRQDWVREKFLRNHEKVFTSDLLNDPVLSYGQVCFLYFFFLLAFLQIRDTWVWKFKFIF